MTRHLTKLLLAASALTVLAVAPAASAAPVTDNKLYSSKKLAKKTTKTVKVAERGDRSDRNRGHRSDRNRGDRSRSHRNRNYRSDRHRSHNHRSDRHRSNRNRGHRSDRHYHAPRRVTYRHNTRHRNYYRPHRRHYTARHYSPYRSNIGISFNFGSPRYHGYRWSPAAYSFYQPSYGSYGYYQSKTVCQRITTEAWHHGHRELISVKQCSNPWDGTYIVQGSERIIDCRW